jgi:hypothetical protein
MPPGLEDLNLLELTDHGAEKELQKRLERIEALRAKNSG